MEPIHAENALYIKLGERGAWEVGCLHDGTLRIGFHHVSHELCQQGNWEAAREQALEFRCNERAATQDVTQLRAFYEVGLQTIWITFHGNCLWWCFVSGDVQVLENGDRTRKVSGSWSNRNLPGELLLTNRMGGQLLASRGYQGTICSVRAVTNLLHKINGTVPEHVAAAQVALDNLKVALIPIIEELHEKDLELLVDLVFQQGGLQRVGVTGGTERDIDLDLIQPTTGERYVVQVKARADVAVWDQYREVFDNMQGVSRFYFVTPKPAKNLREAAREVVDLKVELWDASRLAEKAVRGGVTAWLLDKAY